MGFNGLWGLYRTTHGMHGGRSEAYIVNITLILPSNIRYGVVANIAVSHTAAGGSIPPIGVFFFFFGV
ncbi:hypothetical protein ACN42_g2236 [Penicillium freii]|uniref:Uncharacterized protein n=1 Tax=Penicillium freii TaxID=48697 RepID=A0A124GSM2_PENFR|nr:hypothetical protein ACN42_g2236 [Penicillium freii]